MSGRRTENPASNHLKHLWGLALGAAAVVSMLGACGDDDSTNNNAALPEAGVEDAVATDTGTTAVTRESLGGKCTSDEGCQEGLECFNKGDGVKWPAHGLCSKKCTTDAECAAIQKGAACGPFGSAQQWCFEPCIGGPAGFATLDVGPLASKCHGRADVGCQSFSNGTTACRPICNDDSACDGAKCDPSNGGCTDGTVGSFGDIGNAKTKTCTTHLVTYGTSTESVCTANCVLGVVPSCGWAGPGTKANAACLLGVPQAGRGDQGQCVRVCDSDCDCEGGRLCDRFTDKFMADTGRKGVCSLTATNSIPCADAGADAGDGGDGGDGG